ncbi:hypothetical protein PM082_010284 [Marasmius tenuissimus]|nr:hypothetical protein PM082_010284 [Marasmius tenuissimus]
MQHLSVTWGSTVFSQYGMEHARYASVSADVIACTDTTSLPNAAFRYTDWWRFVLKFAPRTHLSTNTVVSSRRHRKAFHQHFQPRVMPEYYGIQRVASEDLLMEKLATSLHNFIEHVNNYSGSIILNTYGYTMQEKEDPYFRLILGAVEGIEQGASHGRFWVDYLPILKHVPATWCVDKRSFIRLYPHSPYGSVRSVVSRSRLHEKSQGMEKLCEEVERRTLELGSACRCQSIQYPAGFPNPA